MFLAKNYWQIFIALLKSKPRQRSPTNGFVRKLIFLSRNFKRRRPWLCLRIHTIVLQAYRIFSKLKTYVIRKFLIQLQDFPFLPSPISNNVRCFKTVKFRACVWFGIIIETLITASPDEFIINFPHIEPVGVVSVKQHGNRLTPDSWMYRFAGSSRRMTRPLFN